MNKNEMTLQKQNSRPRELNKREPLENSNTFFPILPSNTALICPVTLNLHRYTLLADSLQSEDVVSSVFLPRQQFDLHSLFK